MTLFTLRFGRVDGECDVTFFSRERQAERAVRRFIARCCVPLHLEGRLALGWECHRGTFR